MMCRRHYCVGIAWSVPCECVATARQSAVTVCVHITPTECFVCCTARTCCCIKHKTCICRDIPCPVTPWKGHTAPLIWVFPNLPRSLQEGSERLPLIWTSFRIWYWLLFPSLDITERGDEYMHFIFGVRACACVRLMWNVSEFKAALSVELLLVFYLFKDKIALNVRVF
jgi:hypothetical protein